MLRPIRLSEPVRSSGLLVLVLAALAAPPLRADEWDDLTAEAETHRNAGRYAEAETPTRRALEFAERQGDELLIANSLHNLALLYWLQGRYAEAEPLSRRSLSFLERSLGPEHPDVATSLNILASLCTDQGRYSEAEPLYMRELTMREDAFGPK